MNRYSVSCSVCNKKYQLDSGPKKAEAIKSQEENPEGYQAEFTMKDGPCLQNLSYFLNDHRPSCKGLLTVSDYIIIDWILSDSSQRFTTKKLL